ncbi:MAG TPA: hypothetical protein VKR06_37705 [Ktedonosporobacter sp.]|nr:hypothetical protein [Ktedonosporobacter sp.]
MFRNLSAIEIAEGALLADVAVIFQMLSLYLPVGGNFFRVLIFMVFTILVLRRGLYVGVMGLCVALFIVSVLTGFQQITIMLIECVGGLFLGVTMKYRFSHLALIVLGVLGGALALYAQTFFFAFLAGVPLDKIILEVQRVYNQLIVFITMLAVQIGLGVWWKLHVAPPLASLSTWAFAYWWLTLFLMDCLLLGPIVLIIYGVTNVFVRLLGYDVRPFPGGKIGRLIQRVRRRVLKAAIKRGLLRRVGVRQA